MYRKEVNAQNPLRILERSIMGGLGRGQLGVVMAHAGVGKTAFLVQIGLDDSLRERAVLHLALGQSLEHVMSWYEALFDDLADRTQLENREAARALVARHRIIQAYPDQRLTPERLEKTVELYQNHLALRPSAILIDGFEWRGPVAERSAELSAFKAFAKRTSAELWITATTTGPTPKKNPPLSSPVDAFAQWIDVAVALEPTQDHVTIRLCKDHQNHAPAEVPLRLDFDTLRLFAQGEARRPTVLPKEAFTLLSGGAPGAESAFGQNAERFGLSEINFSYPGRSMERTRGRTDLSEDELHLGEVSPNYVEAQLHRSFPNTPELRRLLGTIWHQVTTAGEVFVVGTLLPNRTVKGGTGWAAELARHFKKPLYVFDQERGAWFAFREANWTEIDAPKINRTRFTGTGTRQLNQSGRAAIDGLFERSFKA